jgi:hypothetical protein
MRGFAITLDSIVALTFVLFAMVIISTENYQPTAPGEIYLKEVTLDALTVLEKTGGIPPLLNGNTTPAYQLVEAMPGSMCMEVSVVNSYGAVVAEIAKSGCNNSEGLDIQTVAMPMMYNGSQYVVTSESWFTEAPG